MPAGLRVSSVVGGAVLLVIGLFLVVISVNPFEAFEVVLGLIVAAIGVNVALTGVRSALVIDADTLAVRSSFRTKRVARDEVTGVDAQSSGVVISHRAF